MAENSTSTIRFSELRPVGNGRLQTEWHLTRDKITDIVKLALPPSRAIPIVFVPGIMGSNLCNLRGEPIWLLNSGIKDVPTGLAWDWAKRKAGERQSILHPGKTKVFNGGAAPKGKFGSSDKTDEYLKRGWGEVSEASYHKFLLWLDNKMNANRNPESWPDFSTSVLVDPNTPVKKGAGKLQPGLVMNMHGLPNIAENGHGTTPIKTDDLIARSKFIFPIYAFGYNWLASNANAAKLLSKRIEKIISENNSDLIKCTQVILVTHSMGGLVARACSQLPDMPQKVLGIVHGVMPATGAAVAYRRCKVGMRDEDFAAGLVIGSDGKEVTAVFAQAPGALQLLPSEDYGSNWLEINDATGKTIKSLPVSDPYEEIYLEKEKWWGLVREDWLSPANGEPITWEIFTKNVKMARDFHRKISNKYHRNTYVFYGGGNVKGSFSKIRWEMKKGTLPSTNGAVITPDNVLHFTNKAVRTDGSNNLYAGGETLVRSSNRGDASFAASTETSHFEIRCARYDSTGDGTVPASSGSSPRNAGGKNVLQQFELAGIQHEPAYRDYITAQLVAYYSITKLAAIADLS